MTAEVPPALNSAIITPLLKKSTLSAEDRGSYRPVSNLSFISKILEKIVALQLVDYLDANDLLPRYHSGYRRGHSTETALLKILSDLITAVDSVQLALLSLLDMSAAFDTVDHDILLQRLDGTYGIRGEVLKWFSAYLSGRAQAVHINGTSSPEIPLKYGVPQGSVLGSILFVLYTDELEQIIRKNGIQSHGYADDNQLYASCKPDETASLRFSTTGCIEEVQKRMSSNRLKLNPNKTQFM